MPLLTSFSPLGPLEIVRCLHRGTLYDVHQVSRDGQAHCLKVPHHRAPTSLGSDSEASPDAGPYLSRATGVETSTWGGSTESGIHELTDAPWLADTLLLLEAEKIRHSKGAWNHRVISLGIWDGVADDWKLAPLLSQQRFRNAMLMPMHPGKSLDRLSHQAQRYIWPRMMSSMWRALTDTSHGDLSLANMILAADMRRFVLIDPGVALWSSTSAETRETIDRGMSYMDHGLLMTCSPRYYPLLPPTYTPPPPLAVGANTWHHLKWIEQLTRFDVRGPVLGTSPHVERWEGNDSLALQQLQPFLEAHPTTAAPSHGAGTPRFPSPADLMALGILYYEILAGQHPLFAPKEPVIPLWAGEFGERDMREMSQKYEEQSRAWQEDAIAPPSQHNPDVTPTEDALAMALLRLEIPHFGELVPLVQQASDQTERWASDAAASMASEAS